MKKILLVIAAFFMMNATTYSLEQIPLSVNYDDPVPGIPEIGKSPIQVPILWIDCYSLYFEDNHPAYDIDIVENGMVVYSVNVPENTASIMLPTWLLGEYVLEIFPTGSNYYFYGIISI